MSTLSLTKKPDGTVVSAAIDGELLDDLVAVTQSLFAGKLQASIVANFDEVEVTAAALAPSITVAFAAGSATGTTAATITGAASTGNHFAYLVDFATPAAPYVGETVNNTVAYTSGSDIAVTENAVVSIYELSATNKAVRFVAHTVVASEIGG